MYLEKKEQRRKKRWIYTRWFACKIFFIFISRRCL